ncbi:MAG: hypothetical protein H0U10_06670 [Chloroflexia bacterium]|nr:hypothetical protein [Chloroflexia bacterium]
MRFVCLNLDIEDASLLRRTLAGSLRRSAPNPAAEECRALHAMIGELDRILDAKPRRRVEDAVEFAETMPAAPRLQLMRGGRVE